jgi:hypothetical protein
MLRPFLVLFPGCLNNAEATSYTHGFAIDKGRGPGRYSPRHPHCHSIIFMCGGEAAASAYVVDSGDDQRWASGLVVRVDERAVDCTANARVRACPQGSTNKEGQQLTATEQARKKMLRDGRERARHMKLGCDRWPDGDV